MAHPQPKAEAARPVFQPPALAPDRRKMAHAVELIGYARDSQRAFEALEALITPQALNAEALECPRSDLGALLRVLNEKLREQLQEAEDAAIAVLHLPCPKRGGDAGAR